MATYAIKDLRSMQSFNIFAGTNYTKYNLARMQAAEKLNFEYDWDDDMYVCPICEYAFSTIKEIQEEHECMPPITDLNAYMKAAFDKCHIPIPDITASENLNKNVPIQFGTIGVDREPHQMRQPEITQQTPIINFGTVNEAVEELTEVTKFAEYNTIASGMVAETESSVKSAFSKLDILLATKFEERKQMQIQSTKAGTLKYKPTKISPSTDVQETGARDSNWVYDHIVYNITDHSIGGGPRPSTMQADIKQKLAQATSKRRIKSRVKKCTCLNGTQLHMLYMQIFAVAKRNGMEIEIIGNGKRKKVSSKYVKYRNMKIVKVKTMHETGRKTKVDLRASPAQMLILQRMTLKSSWNTHIDGSQLSFGTSGFVLNPTQITGKFGRHEGNLFIVRGRHNGVLLSATSKLTYSTIHTMQHYSSVADKFWNNYSRDFLSNKPQDIQHVCTSDFSVEECGSVAALITQTLFQLGRITCEKCAIEYKNLTYDEMVDRIMRELPDTIINLQNQFPRFAHVTSFLQYFAKHALAKNENIEAYKQIERIIGERYDNPFGHVNRINGILIKGSSATKEEFAQASSELLELAQYMKNRTENIQLGSLKSFRNKISGKARINLSLMCDNQLSKNGAFEWGQRSYHAKRFFDQYFEEIDPSNGYERYVIRKNPNGSRKLAIGTLLVSTNLEVHRRSLEGEPVKHFDVAQHCISKRNGNFVYPCCCVTEEDGRPAISDFKAPTKHHLILGNTGDPKFVDLPKESNGKLFVTKEGYCYINIFLAMLIDVSEDQAKDFTKMARDIAISQLGQWPTLMDVAAACSILSRFFPDTKKSELPRILVDHEAQLLHVIDSYGSMSTGYHILKANTVTQILEFARDSLESEIKFYKVGGQSVSRGGMVEQIQTPRRTLNQSASDDIGNESSTMHYMSLLIKSIYRPRLMHRILTEEPYLLLLSMLSPGVLLALFNSGSLERTMHQFIRTNHSLSAIAHILSTLARKVSLSKTLEAQMQILESHAAAMHDILPPIRNETRVNRLVLDTLEVLSNTHETNKELTKTGYNLFRATSVEIREKMYLTELEESWNGLTLCGKFCAMKSSYKWRGDSTRHLKPLESADLKGKYSILDGSVFTTITSGISKKCFHVSQRVKFTISKAKTNMANLAFRALTSMLPDLTHMVNIAVLMSLLVQAGSSINKIAKGWNDVHIENQRYRESDFNLCIRTYIDTFTRIHKRDPTLAELEEHITKSNPEHLQMFRSILEEIENEEHQIKHQSKSEGQANLERIIAFTSLIMMLFDSERSDCIFRCLTKFKTLISTVSTDIRHQSIDEIEITTEERNQVIDFEIEGQEVYSTPVVDSSFAKWWDNQLLHGNTIPHYRSEGHYMKFTRDTAASVAAEIAHSPYQDILLQGGVGSGKSTGLPYHLNKKGAVLLIEPTRPLAQNVHKQLGCDPFYLSTTLRMRGLHSFGSSSVTVMTSGYALHHYANNAEQLKNLQFIIFDECHVLDANAMAFRCLLHEFAYAGKIIKVSATPPGRKFSFEPMHPVEIIVEEGLTLQQFAQAQGSDSNADATKRGDNILVYVSSYSEVDTLGKALNEKGYKVTKVDGRTMKLGKVEIETTGSSNKKHFVVATNIIENGVTLDIDVVVDFGQKVVPILDGDARMVRYSKKSITYGERIQRVGRVGRNKPGFAIRIGATEMGLEEIPASIATEAAFMSFMYGLPVMTSNVSMSILSKCTVKQARTMRAFELSPFFTADLVHYDGTMHPAIHTILKPYKLHDSTIALSKLAIPSSVTSFWKSAREYNMNGARTALPDNTKTPFMIRDIPEMLHEKVWEAVMTYKTDAGFGRMKSANACKLAYTLSVTPHMIPSTLAMIDKLIANEREKLAYFEAAISNNCTISMFSPTSICEAIRARYAGNHSQENIQLLQARRDTILNFETQMRAIENDGMDIHQLGKLAEQFGGIDVIRHQSMDDISKCIGLKGRWNRTLITRDLLICAGVALGGGIMLYQHFANQFTNTIRHQGKSKRAIAKLKYKDAAFAKMGREVYGDDNTIEHYFGEAYTRKGKKSGRTKGTGKKARAFVNMYGFDPADYSYIRYVDPLTGKTIDDQPYGDMALIQMELGDERRRLLEEGELEAGHMQSGIKAYLIKNKTSPALELDLTPHRPLLLCKQTNNIAGYPEREGILRQTGVARIVQFGDIPESNPIEDNEVRHESKSLFRGLRDYNPISHSICHILNDSNGLRREMYGIGFGHVVITNQHLFKENNGEILIKTKHGEFKIKNSTQIRMLPCEGRDMLVFQLPPDIPPFAMKLRFREPIKGEKVCLVGSTFQDKSISSTVSETSITTQHNSGTMWKHWIDTKAGHCGLPLVSVTDGCIVGIHSAESVAHDFNFHVAIPENFRETYLETNEHQKWVKHWQYNPDKMVWGDLTLISDTPKDPFHPVKLVESLFGSSIKHQANEPRWFANQLRGNLKLEAQCPSNLVTKHVVRGKCLLFELYLQLHPQEKAFFEPKMGFYQKSRLNREAFTKDIMKYSTEIVVGEVDCDLFLQAEQALINLLHQHDFHDMEYVTNAEAIFGSLNMKSAVGALYTGKKRTYFEGYTEEQRDNIVRESCKRLFTGKSGIWNGSLKAELRPKEKVEANKTRVFTAAPLDTLLAGKVCVDDFNNHFYSQNLKAPWTVGMTKFYGGWDELLKQLPEGWIYCDADGSQFDSSLSPFLINSVLRARLELMEDWDVGAQMLRNLYTEIVYTAILTPDSSIVKKFKGNNSGQPSTVVDNTLMVVLAMMYTLLSVGVKEEEFNSVCKYFVNGDDLILAIRPDMEYALDSFTEKFASLGLKYDFSTRTTDKTELWFMSHRGIPTEDGFIPKLEEERIVSILEWDRSTEPAHRLEAICASMIEAWGYTDLLHEIRKFYKWVLEQQPYCDLAKEGKAPYISETALRTLYTNKEASEDELMLYLRKFEEQLEESEEEILIRHQSGDKQKATLLDAGQESQKKEQAKDASNKTDSQQVDTPPASSQSALTSQPDRDLDAGSHGNFKVPRLKSLSNKMKLPIVRKKTVLNIDHLISYAPDQRDISNTRASRSQFDEWYDNIKREYDVNDENMQVILNGFMVWSIENGTSPNINGIWVMMDEDEQVEYPLKPMVEYAKPTLRQIMAHFSDAAETYIIMRNQKQPYMPRYGRQRNLNDMSLAQYAFDFYEVTSRTPNRAREAHHQMKAAALTGTKSRLFGIDGGGSAQEENTERHTTADVNANMHTLLGASHPY